MLLSREQFKIQTFKRDNNQCVVCKKQAIDAHHLIERKLWNDGGYYLNNSVSLCSDCHIDAEKSFISVEKLRELAGIKNIVLPEGFDINKTYDKWGKLMENRYKHPRIFHVAWSDGLINDDKRIDNMDAIRYSDVVVTLKMDGENSTIYSDGYYHARSIDSKNHDSRNVAKNVLGQIAFDIPKGWRICAENLYAKHSIYYENLASYVYVHSIWNDKNVCLSVNETLQYCELLGLPYVPILYTGPYNEDKIKFLYENFYNGSEMEGYVIRVADEIPFNEFSDKVAKFVRKGHVQTDEHWMTQQIVPNKLKV